GPRDGSGRRGTVSPRPGSPRRNRGICGFFPAWGPFLLHGDTRGVARRFNGEDGRGRPRIPVLEPTAGEIGRATDVSTLRRRRLRRSGVSVGDDEVPAIHRGGAARVGASRLQQARSAARPPAGRWS